MKISRIIDDLFDSLLKLNHNKNNNLKKTHKYNALNLQQGRISLFLRQRKQDRLRHSRALGHPLRRRILHGYLVQHLALNRCRLPARLVRLHPGQILGLGRRHRLLHRVQLQHYQVRSPLRSHRIRLLPRYPQWPVHCRLLRTDVR